MFGWKIRVIHILSSTESKLSHLFLHHPLTRTQTHTQAHINTLTRKHNKLMQNQRIKLTIVHTFVRTHARIQFISASTNSDFVCINDMEKYFPKQF